MDAIIRIMTRIQAVDQATGVISRVSSSFRGLAGVLKGATAGVLAFGGAKGAYDWTVGAAAKLEMIKLGMGTVISANSDLTEEARRGLTPQQMLQKEFQLTGQIAEEMSTKLQRASILGIGTLDDYMRSTMIVLPQLQSAMGKDFFNPGGVDKAVSLINGLQMASSVLLAGRGDSIGQYQMGARQLSDMIAGTATRRMDLFANMFPEFAGRTKEFNQMDAGKRFELIQERMKSFQFMSNVIQGKWQNIVSASAEFVGFIGRHIGEPIKNFLVDSVKAIPLVQRLLNPQTAPAAWAEIEAKAKKIGEDIVGAFTFIRDKIIPPVATAIKLVAGHFKTSALLMLAAAAAWRWAGIHNQAGPRANMVQSFEGRMTALQLLGRQMNARVQGAMLAKSFDWKSQGGMKPFFGMWLERFLILPLKTKLMILAPTIALFIGSLDILSRAFRRATTEDRATTDAVIRLKGRMGDLAAVITGKTYPAGTTLGQMWNDVANTIAGWLIPVVRILILTIEALVIAFQGITTVVQHVMSYLDYLATEGPLAFGRFINGILSQLGANVTAVFGDKIGGRVNEAIKGVQNHVNDLAGTAAGVGPNKRAANGLPWFVANPNAKPDTGKELAAKLDKITDKYRHLPTAGPPAPGTGSRGLKPGNMGRDGNNNATKGAANPKNVQVFQRGAIQIEIKNMNNYPPDRIAYDMKRILLERTQYKTQGTSNGFSGMMPQFGGNR